MIAKDAELIASGAAGLQTEIQQAQQELAIEKKKQADLLKQQEHSAKRQKRLALFENAVDYSRQLAAIGAYSAKNVLNIITAGGAGAAIFTAQAALATARFVANAAFIKNKKFADGGYTGGSLATRDETGERPAGVVHEKEYVINKQSTAKYFPILEQINKGSFDMPLKNVNFGIKEQSPEIELNNIVLQSMLSELIKGNNKPVITDKGTYFADGSRIIKL